MWTVTQCQFRYTVQGMRSTMFWIMKAKASSVDGVEANPLDKPGFNAVKAAATARFVRDAAPSRA